MPLLHRDIGAGRILAAGCITERVSAEGLQLANNGYAGGYIAKLVSASGLILFNIDSLGSSVLGTTNGIYNNGWFYNVGKVYLQDTLRVKGATNLDQDLTVSGSITCSGITSSDQLSVFKNADTLRLIGTDHCYMEYYPSGVIVGRKAYVGVPGSGLPDFRIINETPNGSIHFGTSGTIYQTISANGNTGFGNLVPISKLDVSGIITASGGNSTQWNTGSDIVVS